MQSSAVVFAVSLRTLIEGLELGKKFVTVKSVVEWRLCLGCGACSSICPEGKIELVDVLTQGIRPRVANEACGSCRDCLRVCPAVDNDHTAHRSRPGIMPALWPAYGPVLEVWEGYASDSEVRYMGSSGGLLTALSLHCLSHEGMYGVVHIAADPADPGRNRTRLSRTRSDLLKATGSRYAPASACDSLELLRAPAPCVFVGQPSEVTALRKAQVIRPAWKLNVGLSLSFFCAGTPATLGTLDLLASHGLTASGVAEVRYRGQGWPGWFGVRHRSGSDFAPLRTYAQSWGFLQRYRPFSVNLSPDGSGEDADISCGDPWYRPIELGEAGTSLVVVRTERGREVLRRAREAGCVTLWPLDAERALASQKNLTAKRGAIWGRIVALRLFGLPAPRLKGFSLFGNWLSLGLIEKAQSVFGTVRRIVQRRWYKPELGLQGVVLRPTLSEERPRAK